MKQAVTTAPHQIELIDSPIPIRGDGEVLLRIERVGICGSDLHIFHGKHPRAIFPRVQGHEASARIMAFAPGCPGSLQVGDRVAIDPLLPCGRCYACRHRRGNCCPNLKVIGAQVDGLLAEYAAVPWFTLHQATRLTADEAAFCEPISVGVQAAHRGDIRAGEQVLVIGAGPIGAAVALAAIDRGARVMVADRLKSRLDLITPFGVEQTVVTGETDLVEAAHEWTWGEGPPVIIDAVGTPAVIRQCCELVAPAGRVVIVGLSDQEVSLPIVDFTYKEMTILGSRASSGRLGEAIGLVERNSGRLGPLISQRFPLHEVQTAIDFATAHPAETLKIMIDVWNGSD